MKTSLASVAWLSDMYATAGLLFPAPSMTADTEDAIKPSLGITRRKPGYSVESLRPGWEDVGET